MNFVWITSYLFVFILGGVTTLYTSYRIINRWSEQEDKKNADAAKTKALQELLAPYTMSENHLN